MTRNYRMSIDLDGEGTFAPGASIPFAYFDIIDPLAADCDVAALCPMTVLAHLLPRAEQHATVRARDASSGSSSRYRPRAIPRKIGAPA